MDKGGAKAERGYPGPTRGPLSQSSVFIFKGSVQVLHIFLHNSANNPWGFTSGDQHRLPTKHASKRKNESSGSSHLVKFFKIWVL